MRRRLACLAIGTLLSFSRPIAAKAQNGWLAEVHSAREEHSVEVQGWLKLVGLESLHAGANSFGSAPDSHVKLPAPTPDHLMVLQLDSDDRLWLHPPTTTRAFPPELKVNGQPPLPVAAGIPISLHSDVITWRTLSFRLIRSGGGFAIRIWDENSEELHRFQGLKWYPPDPHYRVRARFIPYPAPKLVSIANGDGTRVSLPSPGYAEFKLHGRTMRLQPVQLSPENKTLLFAFKDGTAAHETYGAGRFLFTAQPEHGELVLDFNLAENPACAYNPYTVCPLPPRENHLAARVPAGEKKYHDQGTRGFSRVSSPKSPTRVNPRVQLIDRKGHDLLQLALAPP
jgi:uncharacterized protein (DUF1684 family)